MHTEITRGRSKGSDTWSFTLHRKEGAEPVWRGSDFISEKACLDAIDIAKRSLMGLPPARIGRAA